MVTSTDVWWSSHPSSGELSRDAARRSAHARALAEPGLRGTSLPRRLRAWWPCAWHRAGRLTGRLTARLTARPAG